MKQFNIRPSVELSVCNTVAPSVINKNQPAKTEPVVLRPPLIRYSCKFPNQTKAPSVVSTDNKRPQQSLRPFVVGRPSSKPDNTNNNLSTSTKAKATISTLAASAGKKLDEKSCTVQKKILQPDMINKENSEINELKLQLNKQTTEISELKDLLQKLVMSKGIYMYYGTIIYVSFSILALRFELF